MERPKYSPVSLLVQAIVALAFSALLLVLALFVYVEYVGNGQRDATAGVEPLVIPGKSLQVVYGSGVAAGDALQITDYQAAQDEQIAIASQRSEFSAEDFPLLHYGLDTAPGGPEVELMWRLAAEPGEVKRMPLSDADTGSAWLDLARNPDWHGKVLEIGVYATSTNLRQSLSLAHITLEPRGWWGVLCSHWHDWTEYRGWSVRSINYLYGSVDTDSLSPVEVVAAWAALAVILIGLAGLRWGGSRGGAVLAVLLLAWIALDLLWQHELEAQLARTRQQFAGKTQEEKHLADLDWDIYRYIQRLKRDVLPAQVSRIVILHDSWGHNFDRLKAQYYLLPNNSFNFGKVPPSEQLPNVDYVLVFGDDPKLEFRADTGALVWKHGRRRLPVERIDSDPMGSLYRVLPVAGSGKGQL